MCEVARAWKFTGLCGELAVFWLSMSSCRYTVLAAYALFNAILVPSSESESAFTAGYVCTKSMSHSPFRPDRASERATELQFSILVGSHGATLACSCPWQDVGRCSRHYLRGHSRCISPCNLLRSMLRLYHTT